VTEYLNDSIAGMRSEKVTVGTTVTWRDYLIVDGRVIGERVKVGAAAATVSYFVSDHLGSIAVVTNSCRFRKPYPRKNSGNTRRFAGLNGTGFRLYSGSRS
jgi:hypothetical protein